MTRERIAAVLGCWTAVLLSVLVLPALSHAHPSLDERLEAVDERLSREPDNAALLLRRGNLLGERRRWAAALADYERAARLAPALDEVDLQRGRLLNEADRSEEALHFLDRFLERNRNDARALLARARSLERLARYGAAARDLQRAIAHMRSPRPDQYLEQARLLGAAGNYDAALAALDAGLGRFRSNGALLCAAIDLEVGRGRYEAALDRLGRIPRQRATSVRWLARRGDVLEQAGRRGEAMAAYREALAAVLSAPASAQRVAAVERLQRDLRDAVLRLEASP